jgi:pyruvate formate lyase activating enzyme
VSKGIIFNIEEFAVHDGPGIRKLVFFKGCPLKCRWCHNPEGISFKKELMVSCGPCIRCGKCSSVCKNQKCISCGKCVEVCPLRLRRMSGQETEAGELAENLLKGSDILKNSGGGITISGGEPLAQPEFLFDLISKLIHLNIAVETSGYAKKAVFQELVDKADLILMDIKHTDPVIHRQYTGKDNRLILENLKYLCHSGTDFHIRIPLIPGVNDTSENMEKTALLIKNSEHLKRVELLPYHITAGAKYRMVGKEYKPGFDENKKVSVYKNIFEKYNIEVIVL